jgi:hypothetical protein
MGWIGVDLDGTIEYRPEILRELKEITTHGENPNL